MLGYADVPCLIIQVYWLGPLIGAAVAVLIYQLFDKVGSRKTEPLVKNTQGKTLKPICFNRFLYKIGRESAYNEGHSNAYLTFRWAQ